MSRSYCCSLVAACLLLTIGRPCLAADAMAAATAADAVQLPKYDITADRVLPPIENWHYVTIPGFEILSNASARNTKVFVEDFYLLRQVAQVILPGLKDKTSVPTYIVLCGQGDAFQTFLPDRKQRTPSSLFMADGERSAIVINFTYESPSGEVHSIMDTRSNDPFHSFYVQYFRQLVRNGVDQPSPRWLEDGLVQIFAGVEFSRKRVIIGKVGGEGGVGPASPVGRPPSYSVGPSYGGLGMGTRAGVGGGGYYGANFQSPSYYQSPILGQSGTGGTTGTKNPGSFNALLAHRALLPLGKFFSFDPNTAEPSEMFVFPAQAYLFTHLCLYGRNQRFTKPLFKLAHAASQGPISEEVFRSCFGMSFHQMEIEMRSYLSFTDYQYIERRFDKGGQLDLAPKFSLRAASDAESSRIAGEVLRLAGHKQEAINRLIAPYVRGKYDADLLAALGLAEMSIRHPKRGLRFLEAAVEADTTRSRAYVELAQSRLMELQEKAAAEKRAMAPEEFLSIRALLYQGLKHPPALPALYDLLARVWYFSPTAPSKDQFDQLAAGAQANYKDLGLVFRVAALGIKHGYLDTSRRFIAFGLANAIDEPTRARFELLGKQLPAEEKVTGVVGTPTATAAAVTP